MIKTRNKMNTPTIEFNTLVHILTSGAHKAQDIAIEFGWTKTGVMYVLMPLYRLN